MAARKIKNQPASLVNSGIAIYFDSDYGEYQVKIKGKPNATYFTDDKADALSTAQAMRNEEARFAGLKSNPVKESRFIAPGTMLKLRVDAGNDRNGNPRRGWIIWDSRGGDVGFIDEGYTGPQIVAKTFPDRSFRDLGELGITPAVYRMLNKG